MKGWPRVTYRDGVVVVDKGHASVPIKLLNGVRVTSLHNVEETGWPNRYKLAEIHSNESETPLGAAVSWLIFVVKINASLSIKSTGRKYGFLYWRISTFQ